MKEQVSFQITEEAACKSRPLFILNNMKNLIVILLLLLSWNASSQKVFPYINNQEYLMSFGKGMSWQLDFLKPIHVQYSEEIVAYIDNKRDLFVYDGESKEKLSGMVNDYKIGINLLAWNAGPILHVWENGVKQNLTYFAGHYEVSDSLVVFEDTRDNAIRVYYNGEIYDLYSSIYRPVFPQAIGTNTVAFKGNGDVQYAFISGRIIEIGVFPENLTFAAGASLLVFNDEFNQSFAAVFRTRVVDVEPTMVQSYKAGYGIFAYQDRNDNLKAYVQGNIVTLSSYASFYEVFRDMIVWGENGTFYVYYEGLQYEIANYIPSEYYIRDGIVAFRNLNGGISAFHNKTVDIVSNYINAGFEVNGNTIKVQVSKGNFLFFKNGHSVSM